MADMNNMKNKDGAKQPPSDDKAFADIKKDKSAKKKHSKTQMRRVGDNKKAVNIVGDIVLIVFILGVIVGAVFGFRALEGMFNPEGETKKVTITLELENIKTFNSDEEQHDYIRNLWEGAFGNPIWIGDSSEGAYMGIVTDYQPGRAKDDSGMPLTYTVTVECDAVYHDGTYPEGAGYYIGDIRIGTGYENVFRLQGLVCRGVVIRVELTEDINGVSDNGDIIDDGADNNANEDNGDDASSTSGEETTSNTESTDTQATGDTTSAAESAS